MLHNILLRLVEECSAYQGVWDIIVFLYILIDFFVLYNHPNEYPTCISV